MPTLDVEDGFSVHDYREGLKLLRQGGETMTLANREEYTCPVCDEPFDRLLVTESQSLSFSKAPADPICLRATDSRLLVLTH
ncbi:MAG: flagella cluster protein [Halodesulfurarchaeum sp.]|nr:flagella cluster protein [Halodesulfurarchaeum sp.]